MNPDWSFVLFTISVQAYFWASHQLTLSDGSRESAHHHNWSVTVDVSSNELNGMGVVMDFQELKGMVGGIVAELCNIPLDSIDYFQRNSPSAENVAKYIYEKLELKLPKSVKLEAVNVGEEPGCSAKFAGKPTRGEIRLLSQ